MQHQPALDGLRAFAVIAVMAAHAGIGHIVPGGFGVTLFFFLSGYLITSLMRHEAEGHGKVSLPKFYMRRVLRIFPPLYITMVLVTLLGTTAILPIGVGAIGWLSDAAFLTNYAYLWTSERGLPLPLWSLDVEEHFYLLFPVFYIAVLGSKRPVTAIAIIAILCLLELAIRLYNVASIPDTSLNYYWSHTHMDSILFGSALALWQNPALDGDAWKPKRWQTGAALLGLIMTFTIRDEAFRQSVRYTMQGITLFVLFSYILHDRGWISRLLSSWVLNRVGLYSYTLYLCHMPVFQIVQIWGPAMGEAGVGIIGSILSLVYAALMYELIEKRIAQWRRAFRGTG